MTRSLSHLAAIAGACAAAMVLGTPAANAQAYPEPGAPGVAAHAPSLSRTIVLPAGAATIRQSASAVHITVVKPTLVTPTCTLTAYIPYVTTHVGERAVAAPGAISCNSGTPTIIVGIYFGGVLQSSYTTSGNGTSINATAYSFCARNGTYTTGVTGSVTFGAFKPMTEQFPEIFGPSLSIGTISC
jgi:hypothetical protein